MPCVMSLIAIRFPTRHLAPLVQLKRRNSELVHVALRLYTHQEGVEPFDARRPPLPHQTVDACCSMRHLTAVLVCVHRSKGLLDSADARWA